LNIRKFKKGTFTLIQSKHNTFGCWLFFILTFLYLILFIGLTVKYYDIFDIPYFNKLNKKGFVLAISFLGGAIVLFVWLILLYIKKITIDISNRSITFRNIVTRNVKQYNFEDFDGFIDTFLDHKNALYKTIGLVKDKRVVRYIDSFWISNYDELHDSLQNLKYLGVYQFGSWKQLKLLFRKEIID
jgi:hypothetical protein